MRKLKNISFAVLILFIFSISMLYTLQEKLIFLPTTLSKDYKYQFSDSFEEFYINTTDGASLNGLHFKSKNPKGVLLYFHGNAGDLSRWGEISSSFLKYNYDVIVMDYRTYGKSTGALNEKNLYKDAQLFYNYALKRFPEESIIIYGRSIGTAIATNLASQNKPKQLILESPFYSLADVVETRFSPFPVQKLLKYSFPSFEFIKKVNCPITIFHGTSDEVVPYESGQKLFKVISNSNKQFFSISEGKHNNLIDFEAYHKGIEQKLR